MPGPLLQMASTVKLLKSQRQQQLQNQLKTLKHLWEKPAAADTPL